MLNRAYVYGAEGARHAAARLGRPLFLPSRRGRRHPGRDAARHRLDRHRPAARHARGHRRHARRDRRACSARTSPGWSTASPSSVALEVQSESTKEAENLRKLVLAMSSDIRVLLVKLADRLHNMRTLHHIKDPARRRRIARETMDIYAPLAERIGMEKVKRELEELAFAELNPDGRASVAGAPGLPARAAASGWSPQIEAELIKTLKDGGLEAAGLGPREDALFDLAQDADARTSRSSSSPTSWRSASSSPTSRSATRRSGCCTAATRCCRSASRTTSRCPSRTATARCIPA